MTPIPGITRYPSQRGTGWLARFYAAERVHTKLFSDGRYGGDPARSQAAARRWLAELSRCVEPVPRFRRTPVRRTRNWRGGDHPVREGRAAMGRVLGVRGELHAPGAPAHQGLSGPPLPLPGGRLQAALAFRQAQERAMQRERRARLRQQWEVDRRRTPGHDGKDQGDHARGGPEGPGGLHDQGTRQPHDQDLEARSPAPPP